MSFPVKKGNNLSRKDRRKLERKQLKKKRFLFSKKKELLKKQKNVTPKGSYSISEVQSKREGIKSKGNQTKGSEKKGKRKASVHGNNSTNPSKKQKIPTQRDKKYDLKAEQEKDDYLLSYLSKKLKIKSKNSSTNSSNTGDSSKNGEDKLYKELEKDGFDKNLLKLTDIIFGEFQKSYVKKKKKKKDMKEKDIGEEEASSEELGLDIERGNLENGEDIQTMGNIIDKKKRKKKRAVIWDGAKSGEEASEPKRKKTVKEEKKKLIYNHSEEEKKMEKFLMASLNKTSEFNIKNIIQDICKYFHGLKNLKGKLLFSHTLVRVISNHFRNVNSTDIHICICVIVVCVLNSVTYQNLLKDFLKVLTTIFKEYYEDNIDLIKKIERENEICSNINVNQDVGYSGNNYVMEDLKQSSDNTNVEKYTNNIKGKDEKKNNVVSKKEHDKYQDFKIILRNILKCFSLFYALSYLDFDCITDIINVLCENISINSVDNIIIILKICGMKLKNEDISHLNYITDFLKKQIENYVINNNIYMEKSKLRFLIKDIDDLKNGKMKFYFLNKFEFLFGILSEFESKYSFNRKASSFSFLNVFRKDNTGKAKKEGKKKILSNKEKSARGDSESSSGSDADDERRDEEKGGEANSVEGKFHKLSYLVTGEEEQLDESHYNKLLKKYKIQGILPKKIFLIIRNSLDVDECVHNLSFILKKKKNIPYVIQTLIQTLLYDKKYKVAYAKILSSISNVKNRIFLFSLKTIFINYVKNINNYDLKKILFLSKLFIFFLKEKLLNFQIFKFIQIDIMETEKKQNNYNMYFFVKTIFILISLDDQSEDSSTNSKLWNDIFEIIQLGQLNIITVYSFKKIIKKYIFNEVKNIVRVYPHFNIKYVENFYNLLEKQKS
ncbi:conserved Plasmodium protein, unknown function [Plasmodium ovale]|uniref:MI domain-containing protein n=1 Tax=Plasmodium ovale TaxID=36330 RepID=A0A1C3KXK6_PLAOA|nr:conserved Plasmodium protein, unknown function [Plasmodium ovale]